MTVGEVMAIQLTKSYSSMRCCRVYDPPSWIHHPKIHYSAFTTQHSPLRASTTDYSAANKGDLSIGKSPTHRINVIAPGSGRVNISEKANYN